MALFLSTSTLVLKENSSRLFEIYFVSGAYQEFEGRLLIQQIFDNFA